MIRNYLLSALRNLWRNKFISLINLLGMAIGFGIFLTMLTWIRFDRSFDRFHRDIDRMYLLNIRLTMNGSEYTSQRTGGIYAKVLPELFPQVESSCRVSMPREFELGIPVEDSAAGYPMRYLDEKLVIMVDSNFLGYFDFPLVAGRPGDVFHARDHMVITESLAEKLFGEEDPMGKQVRIGEGGYYTVVAVAADPPEHSSIRFEALLGFHVMEELGYPVREYGGTIYFNHLKLAGTTDLLALNEAIDAHVQANLDEDFQSSFFLDSFSRLHLHGEEKGMIGYLLNIILGIVILLIASINFINLSTASSSLRFKEIAIRKSAGAGKAQLVIQLLGETYLLLFLAFYLGFFLAEHLAPLGMRAFGVTLEKMDRDLGFWMQILGIYLLTGLLAGLYPAMKVAGFKPLAYFSGPRDPDPRSGKWFRRVLIVAQFAFSIFIITTSVFLVRQFDHMRNADLGFNREDVLYFRTKGRIWDSYPVVKEELEKLSFVNSVSTANDLPMHVNFGEIEWGEREGEHNVLARVIRTGPDFLETFDIGLQEGEYYSVERDSVNYHYVVVNRAAIDLLGWEEVLGKEFYIWGHERILLGVTENINFFPYNMGGIGSTALIYVYEPLQDYLFVRMVPGASKEQLVAVEDIFRKHNPGYELVYDYVSNHNFGLLEGADGIKIMFRAFSAVAIFIAIMGLLALSQFNNSRRTKEVGIHKVMGAQIPSVIRLLLSDFIRLVILSNLLALPLAWLGLRKLFQFFTYSTELKVSVFLAVFVLSVLLSLLTVLFHAWRSARSNPVSSLRYE